MPDLSRAGYEKRIAELKAQLPRLTAFDRAKLPFDDAIDAQALEGQIRAELLDLETLRTWENNPMRYAGLAGFAVNGLMKRDFAPTAERLRSVTARIQAVPAICAAGKANVKNPPKEFTTLAIRMAKGSVGFLEGTVARLGQGRGGRGRGAPGGVRGRQRQGRGRADGLRRLAGEGPRCRGRTARTRSAPRTSRRS